MHKSHSLRKGRVSQPFYYYVITTVTYHRMPLFTTFNVAQTAINALYNLDRCNAVKTISYILMPDHLHWQFQLLDKYSLAQVVQRYKGRTAHLLKKLTHVEKIWQDDYYDHQIKDEKDLINQARYIVSNPLRAKLTSNIRNYPYWNCIYL